MNNPIERYKNAPIEVKAGLWFTVCNGLQQGAVFFTMPFFTRLMSSQQYGVVTVYNSWLAILLAIVCLNIYGGCLNKMMMIYEERRHQLISAMFGLIVTLNVFAIIIVLAFQQEFSRLLGPYTNALNTSIFNCLLGHCCTLFSRHVFPSRVLQFRAAIL